MKLCWAERAAYQVDQRLQYLRYLLHAGGLRNPADYMQGSSSTTVGPCSIEHSPIELPLS